MNDHHIKESFSSLSLGSGCFGSICHREAKNARGRKLISVFWTDSRGLAVGACCGLRLPRTKTLQGGPAKVSDRYSNSHGERGSARRRFRSTMEYMKGRHPYERGRLTYRMSRNCIEGSFSGPVTYST